MVTIHHHQTILIPLCSWSDGGCCCCCVVSFVRRMWWQWKLKLVFFFLCGVLVVTRARWHSFISLVATMKNVLSSVLLKTTDKYPFWEHKNCFWSQWQCTLYNSQINTYGMDLQCPNKHSSDDEQFETFQRRRYSVHVELRKRQLNVISIAKLYTYRSKHTGHSDCSAPMYRKMAVALYPFVSVGTFSTTMSLF